MLKLLLETLDMILERIRNIKISLGFLSGIIFSIGLRLSEISKPEQDIVWILICLFGLSLFGAISYIDEVQEKERKNSK